MLVCSIGSFEAFASITATAGHDTSELPADSDTETNALLAQGGPIAATDDAGNNAYGLAMGDAAQGSATFSAHGCAAPNQIKSAGSATALARVDVLESFTVVAPGHPAGTPVDVTFQFSVVNVFNYRFQYGDSIGDGLGGSFDISMGAYDVGSFTGSLSRSGNSLDGLTTLIQGSWDGNQYTATHTRTNWFRVGDTVTFYANGLAQAAASADWAPMVASVTDADLQASVSWGASVAIAGGGSGGVDLVSQETGLPAPPLGNGGIDFAEQQLPPRPPTLMLPVPGLNGFGLAVLIAALAISSLHKSRAIRRTLA